MRNDKHLPGFLIICKERIPSVELGAIIPFNVLRNRKLCEFRYKDEDRITLDDIRWCDTFVIIRGTSSQCILALEWAKKYNKKVIGYWDDNFLCIPEYSLTYPYYSNKQTQKNIEEIFLETDAFYSPNKKLADVISTYHKGQVAVLPVVQAGKISDIHHKRKNEIPVVGYAGGIDHKKLLQSFIFPVFQEVEKEETNCKIHIVGPEYDTNPLLKTTIAYDKYIRDYYEYLDFASKLQWDIGLAPQYESEFTKYKFYNKYLEYAYIGCAGIFSKIEPYTEIIQDGINGVLVDNEIGAWKESIVRLIRDIELRNKIINNAYEHVITYHSEDAVADRYYEILNTFFNYKAPVLRHNMFFYDRSLYKCQNFFSKYIEYIKSYGIWRALYRAPFYIINTVKKKYF